MHSYYIKSRWSNRYENDVECPWTIAFIFHFMLDFRYIIIDNSVEWSEKGENEVNKAWRKSVRAWPILCLWRTHFREHQLFPNKLLFIYWIMKSRNRSLVDAIIHEHGCKPKFRHSTLIRPNSHGSILRFSPTSPCPITPWFPPTNVCVVFFCANLEQERPWRVRWRGLGERPNRMILRHISLTACKSTLEIFPDLGCHAKIYEALSVWNIFIFSPVFNLFPPKRRMQCLSTATMFYI